MTEGARRLLHYLHEARVTNTDFAKQLGINRNTVRRWLRGDNIPNDKQKRAIEAACEGYNIQPFTWYMGGE